ncbi:MAG: putative Ig domain-containing protein, partial [Pirellulaceae bacterium]|nr:putative Ig domain-containing protein [Pirellulaceae bacterium]
AALQVGPQETTVPNRIVAALINGTAVDALDASGNFFQQVQVLPGDNVFDITVVDAYGQAASERLTIVGSQAAGGNVDLLYDVSPSFTPDYARTSFDARTELLYAELAIRNVGDYAADKPFYVGIRNISDPTVQVHGAAGVTRSGTPYYDFSSRIAGDSLFPSDITDIVHATFHNPNRTLFTYELVFLAKLNEPPSFDSVPNVEAYVGQTYGYEVDASDPDRDPLSYALLSGPEGMRMDASTGQLTWSPAAADRGVHPVNLRVDDGRGGAAEQRYLLSVTDAPPNRPPFFRSVPLTDATVSTEGQVTYEYRVWAEDPDFDTLQFSLRAAPAGMQIEGDTGRVRWAPTALQPGSHSVTIEVSDGRGGVGEQTYLVRVLSVPGNQPPAIVSQPNTTALADQLYRYDLEAVDADRDALTYSLDMHPDGMSIDAQTGHVSWVPGVQDAGEHLITAQVVDGRGGVDVQSFSVAVSPFGSSQIRGTKFHDLNQNGVQDGRNLVTNWDFESGTSSFRSDLVESLDLWSPSRFAVGRDPSGYHGQWAQFGDHTTGTGLMMIINGATASDGVVWEQDVPVVPQRDYVFSLWAASSHASAPAQIQFYVNGQMIGEDLQLSREVGSWQQLSAPWHSGDAETATVAVRNFTGAYGGNDFVLDDISFATTGVTEPGLAGWTIYLDQNRNGRHDAGELSATTDAQGNYTLANLPSGEYVVAERLQAGWMQTAPGAGTHVVSLTDGEAVVGWDFGNCRISGANLMPEYVSEPPQAIGVGQLLRYAAVAVDADNDPLTYDLSLAPDGMTVHPERGVVVWQPTLEQVGSHTVVLRVRDGAGGTALQRFSIVVTRPNTTPVITSQTPTVAVAQLPFEFRVAAQDADGDAIEYRLSGAPAGMTLQALTGRGTWTPAANQLGTHFFSIIASDGRAGDVVQQVTLEVVATTSNDPPAITSQPRLRARVGQPYGYLVAAHDPNGDPLMFHLDAAPAGMSIDAAGAVQWQPARDLLGTTQAVMIRVEDGRGGQDTQQFAIEVVSQDTNSAPRIVSVPPLSGVVHRAYRYDLAARDPEGDPVVWSLDQAPDGMSIDPLRGTLRWTPAPHQTGAHQVVVHVRDIFFADSTQSFTLDVRGVNLPPSIQSSPLTTADPQTLYVYAPRAADPDGDALTFQLAAKPDGMLIEASTGLVRWTPTLAQVGPHTVRIVVEDEYGGIGSQTFTLHVGQQVVNQPPVISSAPVYHATIDRTYHYDVVARDPEGDALVFALERSPAGMVIDASAGGVTWTPAASDAGDQMVTVVATDNAGARATQTFVVVVRPN